MHIEPYLYFNGRCEEALAFYHRTLGARTVVLSRYGDNSAVPAPQEAAGRVMHAELRIGDSTVLASDGQVNGVLSFQGFSLSLATDDGAEAERLFHALTDGGNVRVPLGPTPFAARFGMVADRFGVLWTISARQ